MSDRMPRASGYFRTDYAQEIALIKTRLERVSLIVFVLLLVAFPFVASAFYLDLATQVFLASIGSGFLIRWKNSTKAARPVGTFGLCWTYDSAMYLSASSMCAPSNTSRQKS